MADTLELSDGDPTNVESRRAGIAAGLFGAIAILVGLDLLSDASTGADSEHLFAEALIMLLALAGLVALWRSLTVLRAKATRLEAEASRLQGDLARAEGEALRYQAEARDALAGLGEAIDRQFERWGLSPAEREVGLLMLKGLSHKEVAGVRQTSEITIRQQALAVYRKSGLKGRSELSAFFLEDLLLPRTAQ
ncbi:MAG: helix-turn-helix transcriptional regulator [Vicinamibacterales bacterium]